VGVVCVLAATGIAAIARYSEGECDVELIVERVEERRAESPSSLQERQDRELRVQVEAQTLEGMKKEAVVTLEQPVGSTWRMRCDEGAYLAGDDTAPPPLAYFSAAIAF
jgi:hypothetical protein